MADEIAMHVDQGRRAQAIWASPGGRWWLLLPGSREGEVARLGPILAANPLLG